MRGLDVDSLLHFLDFGPGTRVHHLLRAASDGDIGRFKQVARKLVGCKNRLKEAVEAAGYCGAWALHFAVIHKRKQMCAYLVEELQVDVNLANETGDTPLLAAALVLNVDIVNYLLDHGAKPDKANNTGFTPLHVAAEKGDSEIVKLLLSKGAKVDPFSSDCGTPLHVATFYKNFGIVKILLDHHADCNKSVVDISTTPLILALNVASLECVKLLLKAGADVKGVGTVTPLIIAAHKGLTDFYKCLLDAGADPNVRDDSGRLPVDIAAYNNNREDVEILFPVTSRVPYVGDWNVDGIINYMKSMPIVEDNPVYTMKSADIKLEGGKAYKKKDCLTAMKLYSMAVDLDPNDATLYSNRSLCWLKMGEGEKALMDAQACWMIQPSWPKAIYLQGAAQVLLKDYEKACDSFLEGLKLDPGNVEIENALRDALKSMKIEKGH